MRVLTIQFNLYILRAKGYDPNGLCDFPMQKRKVIHWVKTQVYLQHMKWYIEIFSRFFFLIFLHSFAYLPISIFQKTLHSVVFSTFFAIAFFMWFIILLHSVFALNRREKRNDRKSERNWVQDSKNIREIFADFPFSIE